MKRIAIYISVFLVPLISPFTIYSQSSDSSLSGLTIGASYAFQIPGGDLAIRFGNNSSVGIVVLYKTKSNWFFGVDFNYLFGERVKEKSILDSIKTSAGMLIDQGGLLADVFLSERGFTLTGKAGKSLGFLRANANSGPFVLFSTGMLKHKIRIDYDKQINNTIPQIEGDYKKGYDRMSNGPAISEFIGYTYFGKQRVVNMTAGLEFTQAWTKNRRGYNFDTRSYDTALRSDFLYGIKIIWYFPVFRRLPDKYYYN